MTTPPIDVARAHRWFAIELNNLAWELIESDSRTPVENERLIHAAHASCFHWLEAGDLLNHLRAQCLLATAYARVGFAESAIRHARKCLELSREVGDRQTAFDRATAHGCASAAYACAGRLGEARSQHAQAVSASSAFADPADHGVFSRLYPTP